MLLFGLSEVLGESCLVPRRAEHEALPEASVFRIVAFSPVTLGASGEL